MTRNQRLVTLAAALSVLVGVMAVTAGHVAAQTPAAQSGGTTQKTAWYFYRVKWGHQDEFVDLITRNHLPVLKEEIKSGRIVSFKTYVPTYHGDGRADWTFAMSITYKDVNAMVGPSGEEAIARRLYPDWAKFQREEARRFEILDAHWDVPLNDLELIR